MVRKQKTRTKYLFLAATLFVGILLLGNPVRAAEKIEVSVATFWWGNTQYEPTLVKAVEKFEKIYPNCKIKKYPVPYQELFDKMIIALSTGTPPDLVDTVELTLNSYVHLGLLEPLDDWVNKQDIDENWGGAQKDLLRINDKYYALAKVPCNRVLVYNKVLFKEAGIEKLPETPEEFFEAAKKLTLLEKGQFGYGMETEFGQPGTLYAGLVEWVLGFETHFAKDGIPNATGPKVVEAMKFYKKLFDAGVGPRAMPGADMSRMWVAGKIGMLIQGPWVFAQIERENPEHYDDFDAADCPFSNKASCFGFGAFSMPKRAKYKAEAGKFLDVFASKEIQEYWVTTTGNLSGRKGLMTQEVMEKFPWMPAFQRAVTKYSYAWAPPGLERHIMQITKIMASAAEGYMYGGKTVEEAMEIAQKDLEDMVARGK